MKYLKILAVLLVLTLLSSCLVSSLHPFYKSKDKIYDPVMEGAWIDSDSSIWVIEKNMVSDGFMQPEYPDTSYRMTYYEEQDKIGLFIGTLFELRGLRYVDVYPDPDEDQCKSDLVGMHQFPTHSLARIRVDRDSIMIYWYGDEWLNDLFEQNRIRIKHETVKFSRDYERQLLTAPTEDLQKFITKYANSPKTGINVDKIFARGYTKDDIEDTGAFLILKPYQGPLPQTGAHRVEPHYN